MVAMALKQVKSGVEWIAGCCQSVMASFYSAYVSLLNVGFYLRYPILFRFDLFLWVFYKTQYSFSQNRFEKSKIDKDPTELTYGETPYASLNKALKSIPLQPGMRFYDLGCGRGKTLLFTHRRFKLNCVGVELMPTYVKTFKHFLKNHRLDPIPCVNDDFFSINFDDADIIFLAWTCMGVQNTKSMTRKLLGIKKGCVVLTTSSPVQSDNFKLLKTMVVPFSWGLGHLYIQEKC